MAYIKFVKGKMEYQSLPGIGTDVYIKVPQIAGLMDKLHIWIEEQATWGLLKYQQL